MRTEWTADGEPARPRPRLEDAAEFFAGDDEMSRSIAGREGRSGPVFRLNHQRKHAWYTPDGDAPDAQWHETENVAVLGRGWDRRLLLVVRDVAVYDQSRMQAFVCNGEVYAVSDDGIVVDTDLQRSVTKAELRVEMSLAGGATFCGPGCQAQ